MKRISPHELKSWMADGDELAAIDIRKLGPYTRGHVWAAIHLPYAQLKSRIHRFVPRLTTRVVLFDDSDELAERAAALLSDMGYSNLHGVAGGVDHCCKDGIPLVDGNYCIQHAFGFFLIDQYDIPLIKADQLKAQMDRGENLVIIDSRPLTEHMSSTVPGAINIPAAEVFASTSEFEDGKNMDVVFHCGGVTRAVLGAQAMLAGEGSNRVRVLDHGTKGWLAHGLETVAGSVSNEALTATISRSTLDRIIETYNLSYISAADLKTRQADEERTTYLVDVRPPADYVERHVVGALSIPGEELAGMTNDNLATWHAQLCLIGDPATGNAEITASWMKHLGWEVVILKDWAETMPLESGLEPFDPAASETTLTPLSADDLDAIGTIPTGTTGDALLKAHADYNVWRESLYPRFRQQDDIRFYTVDEITAGKR